MKTEIIKEHLGEIIEGIENTLFMVEGPTSHMISDKIHLEGCISKLKNIKENLETLMN